MELNLVLILRRKTSKKIAITTFAVLVYLVSLSQTNERLYNMNYMETVLMENFSSSDLDSTIWYPATHFKRGLGFLIDSTITIDINDGKLELKMQNIPNYLDSIWTTNGYEQVYSDFVGGEVITNDSYKFGIFECAAKYAYQSVSWSAFWLMVVITYPVKMVVDMVTKLILQSFVVGKFIQK